MSVTQVRASQRVRIHFGNAVRFGRRILASNVATLFARNQKEIVALDLRRDGTHPAKLHD